MKMESFWGLELLESMQAFQGADDVSLEKVTGIIVYSPPEEKE